MAQNQLIKGVQNNPASNVPFTQRGGSGGDGIVSELRARYHHAATDGSLFSGAICGQVTTVGLATTYTGLCLSNPVGSTKNLVINKIGFAFLVAFPAAAGIGLMTGFNATTNVTHTTPVTPRSQNFTGSGSGGVGLLDSSATLPTAPTLNTILAAGLTGAITTSPEVNGGLVDLEGSIVLPPGAYCAFYTSTVSGAAGGCFSFQWDEVAI